ncbi:MAG: pyridoxal phosphate-dependent aminotransferase [Betaproteobacteria bacterium]|nr:pyridoxal phosphate-dependent aminotransferase [Betaproteobacteria bacterium]
MPEQPVHPALAREAIRELPASRIREVANAGLGLQGVLPFWFGEPDAVTPAPIREAAAAALAGGDTFYVHNLGTPALRAALSAYLGALHGPVDARRIAVTSAGVNALMLAAQLVLSPGDRVVAVTPLWPNLTEIPRILGAQVVRVPLQPDAQGLWQLDLDRLLAELTPGTRAVIINSPANPTGWTMTAEQWRAVVARAQAHGIWILSDEAYERLVFDGSRCAPSALDFTGPDDRVIVANTFSKAWQMTGWRLGWLVAPAALEDDLGKLIEFNTSCAPGFLQQAAVVALAQGEPGVRAFVDGLRERRDALVAALAGIGGVTAAAPPGAMYLFIRVAGMTDSVALAKALVRESGLGLAPGAAFGAEAEGWLRWCFAKPLPMLQEGAARLAAHLSR